VNSVPSPNLRISDHDREAALEALGEHMSVGRIDLDEYGDRSAKVTAVKTRGELAEIFEDLPQPHPKLGDEPVQPASATAAVEPAAPKPEGAITAWTDRPLAQRVTAALVPLAFVAAVALFFLAGHNWLWILLPMGVTAIGRGLWGQEWDKDRQRHHNNRERHLRHERREERDWDRDERRDRRRGIRD
jgi:hypothetical protein